MNNLIKLSSEIALILKKNKQTVSVIESSSGGFNILCSFITRRSVSLLHRGTSYLHPAIN